ncbi:MAG: YdcF family protein [Xanthomonadales bacterium]|nr:YdcF family protein [Xanthomonadales bacterium]
MHALLSPLGFGLLVALLLALGGRRLPWWLRRAAVAALLACVLLVTPLGANALVALLERQVPGPEACNTAPKVVVVLAGGFDFPPRNESDTEALTPASLRRLLAGVALWRRLPQAGLVLAGGGPHAIRESDVLARLAESLGVPAALIRRERTSRTTWENAMDLARLAPPVPADIWLVSSATHLPRAEIAFRAFGFRPCLVASDHAWVAPDGIGYFLPQGSAVRKSEVALHELAGEVLYRWRAARLASSES